MDGSKGTDDSGTPGLRPADRDKDGDIDVDDEIIGAEMQERLKAAEIKAKELANEKAGLRPDPPSKINGVGSSADGQHPGEVDGSGSGSAGNPKQDVEVSEETRDTEAELNMILKKSPSTYFDRNIRTPTNVYTQSSSFPRAIVRTQKRQKTSS